MKNIEASVGAVPTQGKKTEVEGEIEEEEYHMMKNEMIFFLKEAPEYRISGVAEWGENSQGDIVREVGHIFSACHDRSAVRECLGLSCRVVGT